MADVQDDFPQDAPDGGNELRLVRRSALILCAATVIVYLNSLSGPFIFDDPTSIAQNPTIHNLANLPAVFSPPANGETVQGRPLLNFTLAVNWAMGGTSVTSYHVTNLLLHVLTALTLFGLLRRTLLLPSVPEVFRSQARRLAMAAAMIWAVHPLLTECVTYIVQRAESLVGLFYLLTLYCLVRSTQEKHAARWQWLAAGACLAGMASKEVMVSAPLVALLYDRVFQAGSFRTALRARWRLYVGLALTWVLLGVLLAQSANRGGSAGFATGISPWQYAATQFGAIVLYIGLAFWPAGLTLDRGTDLAQTVGEIAPYAIIVGLLLAATAWALWRRPKAGFLGVCFFALLAPSSSIVPVATQTVAEHRMYLPLAAIVAATVLGFYALWRRVSAAKFSADLRQSLRTNFEPALLLAVVVLLGYRTMVRNQDYRSEISIWQANTQTAPRVSRGWLDYGAALLTSGSQEVARAQTLMSSGSKDLAQAEQIQAMAHLETACLALDKAIQLKSDYADAYADRAAAWMYRETAKAAMRPGGVDREAVAHVIADFSKAIEFKPGVPEFHMNRARAYVLAEKFEPALADCTQALSLRPDWLDALGERVIICCKLGRQVQARADIERIRQLYGDVPEVLQKEYQKCATSGASPGK